MTTTFRVTPQVPGLFGVPTVLKSVFVEADSVVTTDDGRSVLLVVGGGRTVASFPADRVFSVVDTGQERIPDAIIGEAGKVEPVNGEEPSREVDPVLLGELDALVGRFGGLGVALQAATYTDPEVLGHRLLERLDGDELVRVISQAAETLRAQAE